MHCVILQELSTGNKPCTSTRQATKEKLTEDEKSKKCQMNSNYLLKNWKKEKKKKAAALKQYLSTIKLSHLLYHLESVLYFNMRKYNLYFIRRPSSILS